VAGLAFASALLAAATIPGHPLGLNVLLVAVVIAAAVLSEGHGRRGPHLWVFGGLGLALTAMSVVRSAEWLLLVDLAAATGLASLSIVRSRSWRDVFSGMGAVMIFVHRGAGTVVSPIVGTLARTGLAPVVRGGLAGLVLLGAFGALFASADAAFAHIARPALVTSWDLSRTPARLFTLALVLSLAGAYVLVARAGSDGHLAWTDAGARGRQRVGSRVEWIIPLGLLDLLFMCFVVIHLTVLFGGREHVLATSGLTYAQYARQGFFQLVTVAALTLALIAGFIWYVRPTRPADRRVMQALLGVLCVLTLVILMSSGARLGVYEDTYGFTRLRISVHAAIAWMAAIFVLVIVAGATWRASWLPRAAVAVSACGLLAFNLVDPDGLIARHNVERFEATGNIDVAYLSILSLDAVPALAELPGPERSCILAAIAARTSDDVGVWGFSLGRDRGLDLLSNAPPCLDDIP
jgi:hypothetical protein